MILVKDCWHQDYFLFEMKLLVALYFSVCVLNVQLLARLCKVTSTQVKVRC